MVGKNCPKVGEFILLRIFSREAPLTYSRSTWSSPRRWGFLLRVFIGLEKSQTAVFFGTAEFGAGLKVYDREEIKDMHVMF